MVFTPATLKAESDLQLLQINPKQHFGGHDVLCWLHLCGRCCASSLTYKSTQKGAPKQFIYFSLTSYSVDASYSII